MKLDTGAVRILRAVVIAFVIVFVMYEAPEFLKPLALAILLAFILAPPVQWSVLRGSPRSGSVASKLWTGFLLLPQQSKIGTKSALA